MKTCSTRLGVNIDHAATLRQARYRSFERDCGQMVEPDPVRVAFLAEQAGADGITVHLREDARHIQEEDVRRLRHALQVPLNLEMACTTEMLQFALELGPDAVCLVPEDRSEVTTEGGLNVLQQEARVRETVEAMNQANIPVSLFIDPDIEQIETAALLKAPVVELHTGNYANAFYNDQKKRELENLQKAAELANKHGITVNAGHGINYLNVLELMQIFAWHELNIGHAILCRALLSGLDRAVRDMKALLQ